MNTTPFSIVDFRLIWRGEMVQVIFRQLLTRESPVLVSSTWNAHSVVRNEGWVVRHRDGSQIIIVVIGLETASQESQREQDTNSFHKAYL